MRPSRFLVLSTFACLTNIANAGSWEVLVSEHGGITKNIVQHRGALYADSYRGVFRSSDRGFSWKRTAGVPPGREITIYTHNGALFAKSVFGISFLRDETYRKLYRSQDDGATWQELDGVQGISKDAELIVAGDALFIATAAGVRRSKDGGNTWSDFGQGLDGRLVRQMFSWNDTAYAATDSGLLRATNDGWQLVSASARLTNPATTQTDMYGVSDAALYSSHDGGVNWQKIGGPSAIDNLAVVFTCADELYGVSLPALSGEKRLYRYNREERRWADLGNPWGEIHATLFPPLACADGSLFTNTKDGLTLSRDRGVSFSAARRGLPGSTRVLGVDGDRLLVELPNNALLLSTDAGKNWQDAATASPPIVGTEIQRRCRGYALAGKPPVPTDAGCPVELAGAWFTTNREGILRSNDGGEHWQVVGKPWNEPLLGATLTVFKGALFAHGGTSVWQSRDAGVNWTSLSFPEAGSSQTSVRSLLTANDTLFVSTLQNTYRSSDGQAWTSITYAPFNFLTGFQGRLYTGFGLPSNGLSVSGNGGDSWTEDDMDGLSGEANSIEPGNGVLYVGTSAGLLVKRFATGAEVWGGIYTCDMAAGGVAMGQAYLVVSGDGTGRTVVSNPALSPAPKYFGKVSGSVSGTDFNGSTSGGTGWRGAFAGDTFRFISQGSDASSGNCRLIFDNQAPTGAPRTGAYTCTVGKDSTEIALTVNRAGQAVITNSAVTASTRYFGYVVGSLTGKDYRGTTDGGQAWSATFDGNAFAFDGNGVQGNCRVANE